VRLTALVESPTHVCCRYRLAAFRAHWERAGYALELRTLPRRPWGRWCLFRELAGANVVLQRQLLPGWQLGLLRRRVRRLIFDFDDAVFLRDSYARKGLHDSGRLRSFAATVRSCDTIIAGNNFLADNASRWGGVERVHVIPTCVEPASYPVGGSERRRAGVELVWVGSSSTLQGLRAVAPMLEDLGRAVPGLRLKLVCDRFFELTNLAVVPCPWAEAREAADIAAADVGISWIPYDLWSRGKCGLKVLQYMAAGLPVVANPVGVHVEMIRHGENGYLAQTPEEWQTAVARLAHDPALRRRMGEQGRRRVEAEYSVAVGANRWLALLDKLVRPLAHAG
jgi:glycosyltransferase involved in cell wall biosynthesis